MRFIGICGWARSVLGALIHALRTNDCRRGDRAGVAWALVLMVSACAEPVEFTVPLAEPGAYEVDSRLVGSWYGLEHGCSSNPNEACSSSATTPTMLILLHIAALPGNKELRVRSSVQALNMAALQLPEDKAELAFGRFLQIEARAHPAKVGEVMFYNVRREAGVGHDYTADGEQPHYIIVRPNLTDRDTLRLEILWHLDPKAEDKSQVRPARPEFRYQVATVSRERLTAWLRDDAHQARLRVMVGPFRRLGADFGTRRVDTLVCPPDRWRRADRQGALVRVARTLADVGLDTQALEAAQSAWQLSQLGVEPDWVGPLADVYARAGDTAATQAAIAAVRRKMNAEELRQLQSPDRLVVAQARAGSVAEAVALEDELRLGTGFVEWTLDDGAVRDLLLVQAGRGDHRALLNLARTERYSVYGAAEAAETLARRGDVTTAREMFATLAGRSQARLDGLEFLAGLQARWGALEDAGGTVARMVILLSDRPVNSPKMAASWLVVGDVRARLGDAAGARQAMARVVAAVDTWPDWILHLGDALIALQLRLGDEVAARATLQRVIATAKEVRVGDNGYQSDLAVIDSQVAIGHLQEAFGLAKSLGAANEPGILYRIAEKLKRDGDRVGEREALSRAYRSWTALLTDPTARRRESILPFRLFTAERALMHAQAGDSEASAFAFKLAIEGLSAQEPKDQVWSLLDIASAQKEAGDISGARRSALRALAAARELPPLAPCDRGAFLDLLGLPELKQKPR